MKKTVVIGFLGTTLDARGKKGRWDKWRPSVSMFQHEDLLVDRFHLLYPPREATLATIIKEDIESLSPETTVLLESYPMKNPWDFEEVFSSLLDYSNDFPFDPEAEDYLLHITTGTHVAQICMFLLAEANYFPAKLLQTSPGRGKQSAGHYEIIDLDLSKYDCIAQRFEQQMKDDISFLKSGIQTRNEAFNRLIEEIETITSRCRHPLLLTGPTGAGKSRLARQIFALKQQYKQVSGQFVEVNCATLRGDMALSILFGHRKGAFTGALNDREGLLKQADGGILFLDEIGELGLDEQAMLLQAIEEKRYLPMGADQETTSDFQLICGTNRDLSADVREGLFREDLLARIKVWSFELPGLRDRLEDIEPNIDYELQNRSREAGRPVGFSKEARRQFLRFATAPGSQWRANFRDLNNSISRMAVLSEGGRIDEACVDREIARLQSEWRDADDGSSDDLVTEALGAEAAHVDLFDRVQLNEVIRVCRISGSLADAGRTLFAESRKRRSKVNDSDRLRKYLQKFGLAWEDLSSNQ